MPTNAEVIARILAAEGVQYVFGLPGGEVVVLIDAIRRAGMSFILTGHEASAAFMADVTGQITGQVGVCVATLGPGAMNLVTGVANAYLDRSPLLALTAQIAPDDFASFPHQRLPLDQIFGGITKGSKLVDGRGTDDLVTETIQLARTGRLGPVHLAIPSEIAAAQTSPSERRATTIAIRVSGGGPRADVRALLGAAQRPLLLIGLGARAADAPAIRTALDATGWPWMTTPKAKGIAPENHPRFLGVASGMAIDSAVLETISLSDLIIGVGFDPVECDKPWFQDRQLVNITRWSTREGRYQPLEVIGEIGTLLVELIEDVHPRSWPREVLEERRRAIRRSPASASGGLSPLGVLYALREVAPVETILACDVGSHKFVAGQFWQATIPHTFFVSNGLSSMGYGLPAAVAAHLQYPKRPVVALVGDGGMLMMQHNLALIASMGIPVLTVVFTDGSLSLIRFSQTRRGLPAYGTDFSPPDFAGVARAHGIAATRVTTLDEVKVRTSQALAARAPYLLEVPVDLLAYRELV